MPNKIDAMAVTTLSNVARRAKKPFGHAGENDRTVKTVIHQPQLPTLKQRPGQIYAEIWSVAPACRQK